jgi:hypothetical protein
MMMYKKGVQYIVKRGVVRDHGNYQDGKEIWHRGSF